MELAHTPKSCWDIFSSQEERVALEEAATEYIAFLSRCKTERETVQWVVEQAEAAGFRQEWAEGAVYRELKGKTVLLARRGRRPLREGVRLLGAHADTPRLDFKQHPVYEDGGMALGKTHYYGGIRKYQWLARPLALHGVVVKENGETVRVCLGEDQGDPVLTIADLLPHLAQEQNERKVTEAFEAEKLNIVLGHMPQGQDPSSEGDSKEGDRVKKRVLTLLNAKYGIIEEDLYSAELQAVPAGPARCVGLDEALIGGYGQDDRICVFCGLKALLAEEDPEFTQVVIFWDKEEIGSDGATGAKSLFMEYSLQDMLRAWEPETALSELFFATKALSGDVHGALDPDFQDLHDKYNTSRLGYGPVFCKFTGHRGKVGANDAHAEYVAWWRRLLNRASIPWQMAEIGKVDKGGGGTVAKHLAIYGMDIIDFGPGVLGMHSPFELSSKADLYATIKAFQAFLGSKE
ncbi:aminopeptidase [Desulfohalobium retbaense]|uniref:M18 family aminopeptidase n=1 Tax=Desulfohalobium retbaense (strain ATCC 49708 / DSM 5692 / JCM 16813 / HR100) TaxID=485915 RepID=C8X0V6_DESRD|nr:aminopeptidase [Desulfohalobium retbaense]ACV68053.1 peptidase M18 aminopeptidase I [Desulfohalobium retbaense DSM 5692]